MPLTPGTILQGRYRIDALLGQGGMGAVYRATDLRLNALVAVKENLETSPQAQQQFGAEAGVLVHLRHPNLPRVTDYFLLPGLGQYLVMDYVGGEDLDQVLARRGALPEREALAYIGPVLDALEYLHRKSVFHRDVKPANIKVTPEGQLFLVDFGLVKVGAPSQGTATGARAATPGYAPLEQYGAGGTDARTDVYAAGATLYAMLAGQAPPDAHDLATRSARLLLRQANPGVSAGVDAAVQRAMQVRPDDRFQSVAAMRAALLRRAGAAGRRPGAWIGWAAGLLALLAVAGGVAWRASRPSPALSPTVVVALPHATALPSATSAPSKPAPPATRTATPVPSPTHTPAPTGTPAPTSTPLPTSTPAPTDTLTPVSTPTPTRTASPKPAAKPAGRIAFASGRDGNAEIYVMNAEGTGQTNLTNHPAYDSDPAWSPDGTRIAFMSDRDGNYEIYVMNADGTGLARLTHSGFGDLDPAWSPDGTRIAFAAYRDGNSEIYVMNGDGSGATRVTRDPADDRSPTWSPDGQRIAFAATVHQGSGYYSWIRVIRADSSGLSNLTNNPHDSEPAWSPDGTRIAFASYSGGWNICVMNADGSGQVSLTDDLAFTGHPAWSPDGTRIAFHSYRDGIYEIYVMNADGTGLTRLTDNPASNTDPAWSPR